MTSNHELIKDLLFLYADDMVSDYTKRVIQDHIKTCTECQQLFRDIMEEDRLFVLPSNRKAIGQLDIGSGRPPFIKRLKKFGLVTASLSVIVIMLFTFASWISGKEVAEEKYKQEDLAHDQELVQLDQDLVSLSPPHEEIYKNTGIHIKFLKRNFTTKGSELTYEYTWSNSDIDYIDENIYWPNHLVAMDLTNNEVIDRMKNSTRLGNHENKESWVLENIRENTEMVGIELPNVAAFFKPPDFIRTFKSKGPTEIQKEIEINHVRFLIKKVEIVNSRIRIYYEQLDNVKEVGLYELSFGIKDANNKKWSKEPKINFAIDKNRMAEIPLYKGMRAPYRLHLEHAVLIIPGMHYKFAVTSSS